MHDGFVEVYAKSTGLKQPIPEHWLDHEVLGAGFELTPLGAREQQLGDGPSTSWTNADLERHMDTHGISRTGLTRKAQYLEAITAAQQATTQTPDPATAGAPDGQGNPTGEVAGITQDPHPNPSGDPVVADTQE